MVLLETVETFMQPIRKLQLIKQKMIFVVNCLPWNHCPDWLRSLLNLPVQCFLTSRESYCEIKFIEWYLASLFKRFVDSIAFHNVFFRFSCCALNVYNEN